MIPRIIHDSAAVLRLICIDGATNAVCFVCAAHDMLDCLDDAQLSKRQAKTG